MKTWIALGFSIIFLMACFTNAMKEEKFDFSGYSLEELLEIKSDLADEIASRPGGEKIVLYSGFYTIGEDLPAGVYTFKFVQNGDSRFSETACCIFENESIYNYDMSRLWQGDMMYRLQWNIQGDGETRISLYPGEYLILYQNGAEVTRIGNVSERENNYTIPTGTTIPNGNYTIGEEIPAGTYKIYYSGTTTSRVRVFQDSDEASGIYNKGNETVLDRYNTEGIITLREGNILRVEYTPIIMTKSEGFTFD